MIQDPVTLDPAQPQRFEEAIDYFRKQAPWVSGSSWATIAHLSALKGDQVSGTTMLRMMDDVWSRMDRAVEQGLPYSEFVRDIGRSFRMDWANGVDSSRLRLIYQNNIGSALMAGRMEQIMDPDVVSDRPFLLFDAIEDMRTSAICRERDGIVLPASHSWWKSNTPLLHHWCRSSVISLDEEDAKAEGGQTQSKKLEKLGLAQRGWGSPHSWEDWKPEGKDYHPALWAEYLKWSGGREYAHDLEVWRKNLARSWSEPLGIDPDQLDEVIQAPSTESIPEVRTAPPSDLDSSVRKALDEWVVGSKRKTSVTLKHAVKEEFGLEGVPYSRVSWKISEQDISNMRPAARKIYDDSQEALRARGASTVRLYRGVKSEYAVQGLLEAWTSNIEIARKFDGYTVIQEDVPIERVFAFSGGPNWKNGKYGEQYEYILLPHEPRKESAK